MAKHSILRFSSGVSNEFFFPKQSIDGFAAKSSRKYLSLYDTWHSCIVLYTTCVPPFEHIKKKRTTIIAKQEKREEEDKEKKGKNGRIEQIKMMASFFFCTPISPVILAMHIFARTHTHTVFVTLLLSYSSCCHCVSNRQFDSNRYDVSIGLRASISTNRYSRCCCYST